MNNTDTKSIYKILVFGLTGLGLIISSGTMAGSIAGSAHDFSGNGWSGEEVCVICHVPHNAEIINEAPLWNHMKTATIYTLYDSPAFDGVTDIAQPGGASILCLSCHDGTVAIDSFGGQVGHNIISGNPSISGANLGTDLGNDHPISFTYDSEMALRNPGLFDPSTKQVTIGIAGKSKTGTIDEVMLYNGQLQCPSCHDVHNNFTNSQYFILKVNNAGSALCFVCHNK